MMDKFQAALLGCAIGDALGGPIEDVVRYPGESEEPVSFYVKAFPSHPVSHLKIGQYTDETQQMLLLAKSLVDSNGFSINDLAGKLVDWFHAQKKRKEWRFPGNTLMKSCRKLAAGALWEQSGHFSAGILPVIRTLPLGLFFHRNESGLKDAIRKSCYITHTDKKVVGVSMVFATIIKMGLDGVELDRDNLLNRIIEKSHEFAPELVQRIVMLKEASRIEPETAMINIGVSGFCVESFTAALYWFFKCSGDFEKMIIGAANSGGDSDAIASIAGSLYGAWYGLSSIPDKWIGPLENAQEIKNLGCDLYRLFETTVR